MSAGIIDAETFGLRVRTDNTTPKMCELLLTNGARYDLTLDNGWVSLALHQAHGVEVIKALIR